MPDDKQIIVYSLDGESFYLKDEFEDMFEDYANDMYENNSFSKTEIDKTVIYTGTQKSYEYNELISITSLIDEICDNAYDEAGEYANNFFNQLQRQFNNTQNGRKNMNELKTLISDFLTNVAGKPSFFSAQNIKKTTYAKLFLNKED